LIADRHDGVSHWLQPQVLTVAGSRRTQAANIWSYHTSSTGMPEADKVMAAIRTG
jgi:hypothetical protein